MTFIVDASLATKWLLPEPDSRAAEVFLDANRGRMLAPELFRIEVASALVRAVADRRVSRAQAVAGVERLKALTAETVLMHAIDAALLQAAAAIAIDLRHPIQDCVYLALADRLGCPLATTDAKFRNRVADPSRVKLLAELV